ncbi:hypothetical protein [Streptomyces sp. NPDC052179]|uniref:hypothetical protein n=1 Tax=Streptomyces sp. NPDC052179 TaxID=3155680 RepID=UPI0034135842
MPDTNGDGVPVRSSEWPSAKGHLLWCPPGEVGALQALWTAAAPELHVLREPFVQHARADFGWINDFESFAELLTGWGDVVGEADRRGWGIIGLRC